MLQSAHWPKWVFIFALIMFGVLFFKLGESFFVSGGRELATDSRGPDLSGLEGPSFMINARLRLVEGLNINTDNGRITLAAGHFLGPNNPVSVCSIYPNVEYEFSADDQASSGDPVLLSLSSTCEANRNGDRLEEIEIPVEKILSRQTRDTEFQIYSKNTLTVKLTNLNEEWPREWSLRSVRLYNAATEIRVDGTEIFRLRGKPLQMKW